MGGYGAWRNLDQPVFHSEVWQPFEVTYIGSYDGIIMRQGRGAYQEVFNSDELSLMGEVS